jgi:IS4 transposase
LITNPRLEALAEDLLAEAKESHEEKGEKVRLFSEDAYEAASWGRKRRVVYKAEAMEQGTNTRFIVTSSSASGPKELYEWYVRRGESENWIKDFKLALKADRLSCHRFIANQFRLLLHAAAYWLLDVLRKKLCESGVERLQLDTLRLRLIKIGGRVRELLTRVKLHLASGHPGQPLWHTLATSAALS